MKVFNSLGAKLSVVGLDFESYYEAGRGAKYTLSKLSTTLYVRSPMFRAHGASIRLPGDKKAWWVSHCELRDVLREIDWKNTALLCHNAAFDGFILSHHYNHVPGYYLDTLSMSRGEFGVHVPHNLSALGERLGLGGKLEGELAKTANIYKLPWEMEKPFALYGVRDVDLMWEAFEKLYYDHSFPEEELHIIDITIRAFCDPKLRINQALCEEEAAYEAGNKSHLVELCGVDPSVLMSNLQLAALLRARGVEPPVKISATTGKETFAFAKADLDFAALEKDPRVADIVRARKAIKSTIGETRARRLVEHSYPTLPVLLNYCGAHTHRWSAGDGINLQNLPAARGGNPARLRRAIEAPPGYVIVVADSSQIEARTTAFAADEASLITEFREKRDLYSTMASEVYGYPVNKHDHPAERQLGKKLILGAGFGMGWAKFAVTVRSDPVSPLDISDELAQASIAAYRRKFKRIVKLWSDLDDALVRMVNGHTFEMGMWKFYGNSVQMPNGLLIRYPGLTGDEGEYGLTNFRYHSRNGWVSLYGGKFTENLIQSTARTIVAFQAIEIAKRYPVVSLVHDEVIFLAPENEADDAHQFAIRCMSTAPAFAAGLPVAAEGGWARNYSK